jgi:type IV secretory pathway VirB3-like protein
MVLGLDHYFLLDLEKNNEMSSPAGVSLNKCQFLIVTFTLVFLKINELIISHIQNIVWYIRSVLVS